MEVTLMGAMNSTPSLMDSIDVVQTSLFIYSFIGEDFHMNLMSHIFSTRHITDSLRMSKLLHPKVVLKVSFCTEDVVNLSTWTVVTDISQ